MEKQIDKVRKPYSIPRYKGNPYQISPSQRHYMAYNVRTPYWMSTITSMSAIACRIALLLPCYYDPRTNECVVSYVELRKFIPSQTPNLSRCIGELAKAGILSKSTKLHTYYLNPEVWLPFAVTL